MNLIRIAAAVVLLIGLAGVATFALAADPVNTGLFGDVAIKGYDPVAYFEDGDALKGSDEHTASWNGATWHFVSDEHRQAFEADPERYAPQYGGYCSYAVAKGKTAGVNPKAWTIVDGKLYLNYNSKIQKQWEENVADFITQANEKWPEILKN